MRDLDNHLESGFQLATFQGPLCAEPVEGMAYFVESVEVDREGIEQERRRFCITYSYGPPADHPLQNTIGWRRSRARSLRP